MEKQRRTMGKLDGDIWGVTFDPEGILRDTNKALNTADGTTVHKSEQKKAIIDRTGILCLSEDDRMLTMGKMLADPVEYFIPEFMFQKKLDLCIFRDATLNFHSRTWWEKYVGRFPILDYLVVLSS